MNGRRCSGGRRSRQRRLDRGFTLLELLVVVAVIGILSTIGIPSFRRALLRSRMNRMASDGATLHKAMVLYYMDHDFYPANGSGLGDPFDKATLEPLVSQQYLQSAAPVTGMLLSKRITSYEAPDGSSADDQYWALLELQVDPSIQLLVADTDQFPGFAGTHVEGVFFIVGSRLLRPDEDILKAMGM